MHKIVFLDIDGVLNHDKYWESKEYIKRKNTLPSPHFHFDPEKFKVLNELTSVSGVDIVISSNWRWGWPPEDLKDILYKEGLIGDIVGSTPIISYDNWKEDRGEEILSYVRENKIDSFVAVDDIKKLDPIKESNFVWINPKVGITENDIKKAMSLLWKL